MPFQMFMESKLAQRPVEYDFTVMQKDHLSTNLLINAYWELVNNHNLWRSQMCTKRIAVLLYLLVGLVSSLNSAEIDPNEVTISGPPELAAAILIDDHTIEIHRFIKRTSTTVTTLDQPEGLKILKGTVEIPKTVEQHTFFETYMSRYDATKVVARRIDGRVISFKILKEELSKKTPIVLVNKGQQVDPFFVKTFSPETLVLLTQSFSPLPTGLPNSTTPTPTQPTVVPNSTTPTPQPDAPPILPY